MSAEGKESFDKSKAYLSKGLSVLKGAFDKSVAVSKSAFSKAGDAVQDFGDKSVLRIEKRQAEAKRKEQYMLLGKKVAERLTDGKAEVVRADDAELLPIIDEIKRCSEEINKREVLLAQAEG